MIETKKNEEGKVSNLIEKAKREMAEAYDINKEKPKPVIVPKP